MNFQVIDAEKGVFQVLDAVLVRISSPYWTQSIDINEEDCRGTIFNFVDSEVAEDRAIASIEIIDVSNDQSEPDVSLLNEDLVAVTDRRMQDLMATGLSANGMELVSWMSSKLNQNASMKGLMTPFIVEDGGKRRQFLDLRFNVGTKKFLARGTFDIDRSDELAAPIFMIMKNITLV